MPLYPCLPPIKWPHQNRPGGNCSTSAPKWGLATPNTQVGDGDEDFMKQKIHPFPFGCGIFMALMIDFKKWSWLKTRIPTTKHHRFGRFYSRPWIRTSELCSQPNPNGNFPRWASSRRPLPCLAMLGCQPYVQIQVQGFHPLCCGWDDDEHHQPHPKHPSKSSTDGRLVAIRPSWSWSCNSHFGHFYGDGDCCDLWCGLWDYHELLWKMCCSLCRWEHVEVKAIEQLKITWPSSTTCCWSTPLWNSCCAHNVPNLWCQQDPYQDSARPPGIFLYAFWVGPWVQSVLGCWRIRNGHMLNFVAHDLKVYMLDHESALNDAIYSPLGGTLARSAILWSMAWHGEPVNGTDRGCGSIALALHILLMAQRSWLFASTPHRSCQ